jgi:hypothetical protein
MRDIISVNPEVENVTFISDGAASQCRQHFLFANLMFFKEHYEVTILWHCFDTSHGKGDDGIGRNINEQYGQLAKWVNMQ